MRRQLIDNTLTFISALCVYQTINSIFNDFQNFVDTRDYSILIRIVIIISLMGGIIYKIYYEKKSFIDAFDMLNNLAKNNKLHPLREVVMVVNDQYKKRNSKYIIRNAAFHYTLLEDTANTYDVIYEIILDFDKIFFSKESKMISFYAILDTNLSVEKLPINIAFKAENETLNMHFNILPISATVLGIDHIDQFAGLYEICFQIPKTIIDRFRRNQFHCVISYVIENNFSLKDKYANNNYNFFIYTNNYGKKIVNCDVDILVPKDHNFSIICQQLGIGNNVHKISDFIQTKDVIVQGIAYSNFYTSFTPQKNTSYFFDVHKLE